MQRITVIVRVQDDDRTRVEKECTEKGGEAFARELFEYASAELTWQRHREELKPIDGLTTCPQHASHHFLPPAMFDIMNRQELWREIQNTVLDIVYGLAQAKAYKDIEPNGTAEQWYPAHSRKVAQLNIAALYLAKIHDLVVRLLFESFGGTAFIPVNTSDEDWEKALTMSNAEKALKRLRAESKLDTAEFNAISDALQKPAKSQYKEIVVRYRNCVAHRVRPSIDHWELSPALKNREGGTPLFDNNGKSRGTSWAVGAHPTQPDFEFLALYEAMKDYLMHVYAMLTEPKAIAKLA